MRAPRLKAWVDPAATRHALYLGHGQPTHVDADRLALIVETRGSATVRVPLPRIDRIVSGLMAHWTGTALIGCAEAGIPVAFAARDGRACASLTPLQQSSGRLDAELTLFAESPNAHIAWQEGLRVLRSRLLMELWQENGQVPEGPTWNEQRREFVYRASASSRRNLPVDARCHALVVCQLQRQGLQQRYATRAGRWLELALDLSTTLHDLHELTRPLEVQAGPTLKLRALAFEASDAARYDTISWCLLILRRSTHEHVRPWL